MKHQKTLEKMNEAYLSDALVAPETTRNL